MAVAVTGATGYLGGGIIDELLRRGRAAEGIVPVVRSEAKAAAFTARGMRPRIARYEDAEALRRAFDGVGAVVLVSSPDLNSPTRVRQLHNAVIAAHDVGIEHLLYIGLAAPEKQAFGLEDVELATEYLVRALEIPSTFVRNGVYFDELRSELEIAARTGELASATGNQPLNWALRQDMAAAVAAILQQEGHVSKTYELTAARTFTYDDLAAGLSQIVGRTVVHRQVDPDSAVQALTAGGMAPEQASDTVETFQGAIAKQKFTDHTATLENFTGRPTDPETSLRTLFR